MSDTVQTSYVDEQATARAPKTDAERALLKSLNIMFTVYDFTRLDRISLSRDIIAALDAAERINSK